MTDGAGARSAWNFSRNVQTRGESATNRAWHTAMVSGVRTDRDSGIGQSTNFRPTQQRLARQPIGAAADLLRRDEQLDSGHLDMAVINRYGPGPRQDEDVLATVPTYLVCLPGHGLAGRSTVPLDRAGQCGATR